MSNEERKKFVIANGYVPIQAVVKISNRSNLRIANCARVYIATAYIPKSVYNIETPEHDGVKRIRTNEYIFNSRYSARAVYKKLMKNARKINQGAN